jgi:hypothetical protein
MVPNYQIMSGEILFFYAIPYHHWACPSTVTDVAATFLSTTLLNANIILRHDEVMRELIELGTNL